LNEYPGLLKKSCSKRSEVSWSK